MMLSPKLTFEAIKELGFEFFCGVPDSLLKDFCAYISDHTDSNEHVITANEGNAVAMAVGHYLASAKPAVVYMQNSGIGNAVNPLLSLADKEVYSIPMLLIVGWRGEPGVKDEPQHVKQGRIMEPLVDAMELPQFVLPADQEEANNIILAAHQQMIAESCPVVLHVRKGSFAPYKLNKDQSRKLTLSREEAIETIVDFMGETDVAVSTTGMASRELFEIRKRKNHAHDRDFLTVGGMGHTASIALAVAMKKPDMTVFCIDGDGSAIMHLGALSILANSECDNLIHVLINNGAHDSVGGQPTVGHDISLTTIAKAMGYRFTETVDTPEGIRAALLKAHKVKGCKMIEVLVRRGARPDLGRPTTTPIENKIALMKTLEN